MININELTELCTNLGCKISTEALLGDYTTFRFGGACRALIDIASAESASEILRYIRQNGIKYAVIGRGSNIIASDEGFDGVVLHFGSSFSDITADGGIITAQAGAMLSEVCKKAKDLELSGMENLFGIPGTVGGALYMNAGAYGSEMKDIVVSAEYIDENGSLQQMSADDMDLSYRHSIFAEKNCIITSVTMKLGEGRAEEIQSAMQECMQKRREKQPLEYPSAGSTFKRPQGSYASLLIEQCGLKGLAVGGAEVSIKHSGFVINKGGATCADVLGLCEKVRNIVLEKTGYTLELEPVILK
ncbi:MAG: UDP-N-acetylmuramate dehydrogenase [Ruminococcus flavefaciens]|nr:UDP-N-acetylmuramate dehydrogenase [Ruminococcus flavefaciens]MCM1231640.1 UDP-N-acetylmuramate dehydrogenase [Ruminococcus flavefaciens]